MLNAIFAVIDVSAYTTALDEVTDALGVAVPVVALAALGIAAGLIVLRIGLRIIKRFTTG